MLRAPVPESPQPVYAMAVEVHDKKDDAKLSEALTKLMEEDPSYSLVHCPDTGQFQLWGQGEIHLRAASVRLAEKYGVSVDFVKKLLMTGETERGTRESIQEKNL